MRIVRCTPPPPPVAGLKPVITPHTGLEVYHSTMDEGDPHHFLSVHSKLYWPPVLLSGGCLDQVKGKSHSDS